MPDLETLLRDVRPAPDPVWATRLDARAEAGFPRAWRRWLTIRTTGLTLATASVAAVIALGAVNLRGSGVDGATDLTESVAVEAGGARSAAPELAEPGAADEAAPVVPDAPGTADAQDRSVLRSASLTLSAGPDEVERTTDRAIRITDALGGYVATSSTNVQGSIASAELVLRVPADKLDTALAQLSKLAHVKARSQQADDVTDQRAALEAAVRDARADRDGLRARLRKAATDAERSRLRAQLDRATRRVTQRERRVAALTQEVSYATVALSIEGDRRPAAAPPGRWTPADALKDAGRVLEVMAGALLIALAVAVPLALLAALAALAGRGLTRRRRERALEAS